MLWIEQNAKIAACGLLVAVLGYGSAALANTIVVKSDGPSSTSYKPGDKLALNAVITLKAKDVLTILDGRGTRTLRGPGNFNTSPATNVIGDTRNSLTELLTTNRAKRARTGAVRGGVMPAADKAPRSPNLWFVDISQSSTACVPDLANIQLWRPDHAVPLDVKVTIPGTKQSTTITFVQSQSVASWPSDEMPAALNGTYALTWAGLLKPITIKIASMDGSGEGLESTASALITKGCRAQLDLLVETVALPDPAPM